MDIDNYLDKLQGDTIQEVVDPLTVGVVGSALVLSNFIIFLLTASALRRQMKVDKKLTKKLNDILSRNDLVVHRVPDQSPNAFAAGGKHVYITTGLTKLLSQREVEAVLLHEVFHNKGLHIYKKMAYEYPLFYLLVYLAISVATVGVTFWMVGFLAFVVMLNIARIPYNVTIGRRHERKADEYAVKYGYGTELVSALKKLEKMYQKMMAGTKCGKMCQVVRNLDDSIDEHPPLKKRIETVLKKGKKLEQAMKSMSFKKIKDLVTKG